MTKVKKLVLGVSVALSMLVALVVGFVCNFGSPTSKNVASNTTISGDTEVSQEIVKPTTYTYLPGEVLFKRGGSTLNYNYTPSADMKDDAKTVAYEYCFGNTMQEATAVNLKEIDTTDVTVSYAWSLNTKLDTTQSITTYTNYELQKLNNYGDKVYIYVFVTPTNETIPTTFTSSIVWYYGIPYEMPIFNNVTNTVEYQTIVDGQKIDKNTLTQPESFTKIEIGPIYDNNQYIWVDQEVDVTYYFDAWFLDKDYTQMVDTDEVKPGQKVYARFHNVEFDRTDIMTYSNGSYTFSKSYSDDSMWEVHYLFNSYNIIIPTIYDDGTNGRAYVTNIGQYAFYDNNMYEHMLPRRVDIPSTITTIEDYAFHGCYGLTSITLPNNLTSIGSKAFYGCYALVEIYNLSGITITAGDSGVGAYAKAVYASLNEPSRLQTIDNVIYYVYNNDFIALTLTRQGITNIILDSRTTEINHYAFCYSYLTSITLPSSLTSIGNNAFYYCDGLISIVIPASVTKIGSYAFSSTGLTSLTIQGWDSGTWYKTTSSTDWNNMTNGTEFTGSFADASQNATWFKSTSGYYNYYWYKVS